MTDTRRLNPSQLMGVLSKPKPLRGTNSPLSTNKAASAITLVTGRTKTRIGRNTGSSSTVLLGTATLTGSSEISEKS